MFKKWLDLAKIIFDDVPNQKHLVCPKCGKFEVDYQYVGDNTDRIGYLDIWCKSCLIGIHLSRTKAPEKANMLTFDIPLEKISERIPNFVQITPGHE
jgi:hypothetical protein